MKIIINEKQAELIIRSLDLNYLSANLDEWKDDKEFYKEQKKDLKTAIQITNKIKKKKSLNIVPKHSA